MRELLEKTLAISREIPMKEFDYKKALRTAALVGVVGATTSGLGHRKGLSQKEVEKSVSVAKVEQPIKDVSIDMNKIAEIESSNVPDVRDSSRGARGLCQIIRCTWEEMVIKLGKDWSWEEAHDPEKNKIIANYYLNIEIPRLLKHFGLVDTIENRLASYNWGIGNLKNKGLENAPQETLDYIEKYKSL